MIPLSIQLFSLRNVTGLEAQFDLARAAGYSHVELFGSQLDDAANVKALLDARGMSASSSHVSIAALRDKPQAILAACKTLGFKQLFMPAVPPDERASPAPYWLALGRELGAMTTRFADAGIVLGYHNHHWEMQLKEDGKTALEWLFEGAAQTEGASPLAWQVDVAWLVRGGVDPAAWMQRYAQRVVSAHAKDLAPAGECADEDGWADVGHGRLDWQALSAVCKAHGVKWFVAEHDKPNDAARFANRSYAYLASLKTA